MVSSLMRLSTSRLLTKAEHVIAQASAQMDEKNRFVDDLINVRHMNEFTIKPAAEVTFHGRIG